MADDKPIIVVKKKGSHGGHHGGAWKVAYADFVTAMMAFFMVMWLVNTAESPTKEAIAAYFRKPGIFDTGTGRPLQLGGAGILDEQFAPNPKSAIQVGANASTPLPKSEMKPNEDPKSVVARGADSKGDHGHQEGAGQKGGPRSGERKVVEQIPGIGGGSVKGAVEKEKGGGNDETLKKMAGQLQKELALSPELKRMLGEVTVTVEPDGIRIEILDTEETSMFSAGSAQVTTDATPAFNQIAKFIQQVDFPVEVSGHTDAKPFSNRFQNYTNWELSADRANAARRLLERQGVSPGKIQSVLGMADRDLKLPEDPTAASNRRITVKLKLPPAPPPGKPEEEARQNVPPEPQDTSALFSDSPVIGPSPIFALD
jgi:chemotaxis protein MotB